MKRKVNTLQGFKKGGKKQDWVSEKISMLMKEGKPQDQAIAMALSMWGQKHEEGGYQLPMYQTGETFTNTIDPNLNFKSNYQSSLGNGLNTGFTPEPYKDLTTNEHQNYFASMQNNLPTNFKDVKDDASKQKQVRNAATQTMTSWQTPQLYSGMDIATSANMFGKSLEEKDAFGAIASGLKLATGLGRNIAGGYGRANRQEYVMQDAAGKLRDASNAIGYEEALPSKERGGYYNENIPMYQDAGMYIEDAEGYQPDMISKYQMPPAYNFNQDYETGNTGNQVTQVKTGKKIIPQGTPFDPNSARDLWTDYTGLSWAEAKKRGYTDGSAKSNMALLDRLRKESVASVLENKPKRTSTRVARATQNRAQQKPEDNRTYNGGTRQEVVIKRVQPSQEERNAYDIDPNAPEVIAYRNAINKKAADEEAKRPFGYGKPAYVNKNKAMLSGPRPTGYIFPAKTQSRSVMFPNYAPQIAFEDGGYFQDGGMQPGPEEQMEGQMSNPQEEGTEQQGGGQMEQVMQEVSQALQQGVDPQQVVQQLVQMGIPQDQATQLVQQVLQMIEQQGQQQMPASPQLRHGGYYQEGGEQYGGTMGQPQEAPSNQGEDVMTQVAQALQEGAEPGQLVQQLTQSGMPQDQATQIVQQAMQMMEQQEQPMMQNGGEYLKNLKGKTIKNYTYNSKTGNYDVEFE
jgi:hypothetical protein